MEIFWLIAVILVAIFSLWLLKALFSVAIKLLIAALIVIVLFSVFVNGAESKVFEGYVFSDQSITVDDKPLIITFESDHETIMLNYNQRYYFVPLGDCKTVINLKFCYGSVIYDTDKKKDKVNITVFSVEPEITITRVINNSVLRVGEEAEISVNVTNGIGLAAENFTFTDSFSPDEFEITDVSWCSKNNSSVYYHGFLRENEMLECSYKIKPLKELKRATKAKVSYYDGVEMQDIFSTPIEFDVSPFFSVNAEFNETDSKVFLGEEVLFIINLTNSNEDLDADLKSFDIFLPSGIQFIGTASIKRFFNATSNTTIRSQQVEKSGSQIHFEGELKRNETKFIILKLKAVRAGSSNIFLYTNYSANGMNGIIEAKKSLEVENEEVSLQTNFKDSELYDSGEEALLRIDVINPSSSVILRNIAVKIDSPIYDFPIILIDHINKTYSENALYQRITMPRTDSNKDFEFNVTVFYETEFGERLEKGFEYTLTIEAVEGLEITHDFSDTTVEEGDEITVKTKVENRRNVDVKDVRIFDVVPMDFSKKGLNSVSNININALDTVTAYEYKLTAPKVPKETKYKIRAVARFVEDNKTYAFEKEEEITVIKKSLDLSISSALSETTPFMGAIIDVLYTITNPEEEQLKNIVAYFPVQEMIELVGQKNFTVDKLDPGESYTIRDVHRIRAKTNESITLAPTFFVYEDEEGNVYTKNSSQISFSPEFGYIAGPAFIISQKGPERVRAGDKAKIILNVRNIGTEEGKINVIDGSNSWIFSLKPDEDETASYSYDTYRAGQLNVKPLKGEYYYIGKKIYTVSNPVNVTVFREEEVLPVVEEKAPEEEIIVEEKIEKKTFFEIMLDTIKQIFAVFKR